jgi:hypothetical protein
VDRPAIRTALDGVEQHQVGSFVVRPFEPFEGAVAIAQGRVGEGHVPGRHVLPRRHVEKRRDEALGGRAVSRSPVRVGEAAERHRK